MEGFDPASIHIKRGDNSNIVARILISSLSSTATLDYDEVQGNNFCQVVK